MIPNLTIDDLPAAVKESIKLGADEKKDFLLKWLVETTLGISGYYEKRI